MGASGAALADEDIALFKVVSVKDEVIIGLSQDEAAAIGGPGVEAIGKALGHDGQLSAWKFAVRKGEDGELEMAPLMRVSLIGHDSLRVEPYATPLRIVPVVNAN